MFPFCSLYKTNRFQVAVRLFSNISQMTSKCGKNISDTLACEPAARVSLMFLPHFDVICDLLLNRRTATGNLFVKFSIHAFEYSLVKNGLKCRRLISHPDTIPYLRSVKKISYLTSAHAEMELYKGLRFPPLVEWFADTKTSGESL